MPYNINEACNGCTVCAINCPVFAISGEKGSRHLINEKRCVDCGVCGRVCQNSAVSDNSGKLCSPVKRSEWQKPQIDTQVCSACQICVHDCKAGALRISLPKFQGDINVFAELFNSKRCVGCGICEKHCPVGAVKMGAQV